MTCLVANEMFPEFFNVREADINIRVGGGNDLPCKRIADLWVKGAAKPILLEGVRIVPGFGVNIVSGPYLEQGWEWSSIAMGAFGRQRTKRVRSHCMGQRTTRGSTGAN